MSWLSLHWGRGDTDTDEIEERLRSVVEDLERATLDLREAVSTARGDEREE